MLQYLEWTVSIEQGQPVNHNATVSRNIIYAWAIISFCACITINFSAPVSPAATTALVSFSISAIQISSISTTEFGIFMYNLHGIFMYSHLTFCPCIYSYTGTHFHCSTIIR